MGCPSGVWRKRSKDINRVLILGGGFGGVAAERIAALFAARPAESAFVGEGGCFLGVSGDQAVMVRGQFLAEPAPDVEITVDPPDLLDAK